MFERKKYVTQKELDLILISNFGSIAKDVNALRKDITKIRVANIKLREEFYKDKEVIRAFMSVIKNCVLTKAQLNKKIKIQKKDYSVEYLLKTAISELSWERI